jgi:hypothetical protein
MPGKPIFFDPKALVLTGESLEAFAPDATSPTPLGSERAFKALMFELGSPARGRLVQTKANILAIYQTVGVGH